jgi:succinoglycan biosynthesis transport protein ExoP
MTAHQPYVAIVRRTLDLEDYIDVARRHVGWIIGPMYFGIIASIVTAFLLPNRYVSVAEMQITPAQIPDTLVRSTLNQQLNDRIISMENEILSRTSLSAIIQDPRLNLYAADRAKKPLEDVIEQMRTKDVRIEILQLPGAAAERKASAFKVQFEYSDRFKAQQTVQALISKFEDANTNTQRTQQQVVTNYMQDSLAESKANLDKLNEDLTRFRIQNQGKLPEQSQMNISQLTALQAQASGINDALNRNAQQKAQLEAHLATLNSQKDMLAMFDKEAEDNGGVTNGRNLPLASPQMRQNERLLQLNKTLDDGQSRLEQMRQVYKDNYPDIRDLRTQLEVIRKERDTLDMKQREAEAKAKEEFEAKVKEQSQSKAATPKSTNYQVAQNMSNLTGQIDQTKVALQNLESERVFRNQEQEKLNKQIEDFRNRLTATSGIEATYATLIRDQTAAQQKYQEQQVKEQLAAANGDLIQRQAAEKLDVLDPPSLPVKPSKPDRWLIVGAGAAISLLLGLALAGVQEAKDTSLKNLKDVRAYTNLPVLCSIPLLENTLVVKRKRRLTYLVWSAAVIMGIIAVTAALFYYNYVVQTGQ